MRRDAGHRPSKYWLARLAQALRSERGVAAPLLAVGLVALLGASALSVDMGNNWQRQRQLSTAVDAATLAAANAYANGDDGCGQEADRYLGANDGSAVMLSCERHGTRHFGWVTVTAQTDVDQFFGQTLGVDDVRVSTSQTAMWGQISIMDAIAESDGLRPMGLCLKALEGIPAFADWLVDGGVSAPVKVPYGGGGPDSCGNGKTSGNWGVIDFDGGNNSNAQTNDWIEGGYTEEMNTGWYPGDPGALGGSSAGVLHDLKTDGTRFTVPLYSQTRGTGANAEFKIDSVPTVTLIDYKVNGGAASRYITLQFEQIMVDSTCCVRPTGETTIVHQMATRMAAVDADGNIIE